MRQIERNFGGGMEGLTSMTHPENLFHSAGMMKLLLVAASVIAADAAKTSVKILFAGNS